jgi:hypothetical protein
MPDNRCTLCHGHGGHIERDERGGYVVPCADCLQKGICPRCAATFDTDTLYPLENFICPTCGWVLKVGRLRVRGKDE